MQNGNRTVKALIFFLLLAGATLGQNATPKVEIEIERTPENVAKVLKYKKPTALEMDTLIRLGKNYHQRSKDTVLLLAEHAVLISKGMENQIKHADALALKGSALLVYGDADEGVKLALKARDIHEKGNYIKGMASVDFSLGVYYLNSGQYETSAKYYLSSIELSKKDKSCAEYLLNSLSGIAGVYYYLEDLQKSQKYLSEAISVAEKNNEEDEVGSLRGNQAVILNAIGNNYLIRADSVPSSGSMFRDSAKYYFKLGMKEAEASIKINKEIGIKLSTLSSMGTLAALKVSAEEFQDAAAVSREALKIAQEVESPTYITRSNYFLAKALFGLKQYDEGLLAAKAAFKIAEEKNFLEEKKRIYEILINLYVATGDSEAALAALEKMRREEKTANSLSTKKAITEAETKYQTAEKEKKILELAIANDKISKQRNLIMGGGIILGLLGFFGYRLNKVNKDRNDKKAFAEALIFAQEEERKRIGRDLHDGIGQSLLLIKKQLDNTAGVTLENQQMISATLEEVRSISQDLHPFQLDKFGLTATISDMVLKIEQSTDLFITREIDDIDKMLDPKSEIHLYRTIQESLSNIVKHAGATAAKISVKNRPDNIQVSVLDNGKGFDLELAVVTSKSLGIRTMHERISAIGGKLKIEKGETSGTQVNITVPKSKINL